MRSSTTSNSSNSSVLTRKAEQIIQEQEERHEQLREQQEQQQQQRRRRRQEQPPELELSRRPPIIGHHHNRTSTSSTNVLSSMILPPPLSSSSSSSSSSLSSSSPHKAIATTTTTTTIVAGSSTVSSSVRPVYRQYILDRISGNSYIPLHRRDPSRPRRPRRRPLPPDRAGNGDDGSGDATNDDDENRNDSKNNSFREEKNLHDSPEKFGEEEENGIVTDMDATDNDKDDDDDDDDDDPTDCWKNRPPHFLCYVPPCVRRCPRILEQNMICEYVGQVGWHSCFKNHHLARRRLFSIGFFFNFVALCLTIVAAMAYSINFNLLTSASFTRGEITVPQWANNTMAILNIGFRAVAITDQDKIVGGDKVAVFDDFCSEFATRPEQSVERFLEDDLCSTCRDSSERFVLSCILNIVIILRNMFSDITRMYPKYDLNCPNFYGSLMATLSVILGMYTILAYRNRCFRAVEQDLRPFYRNNFTIVPEPIQGDIFVDPDDLLLVQFKWKNGPGFDCLMAATLLRFVDAICNYIVPTPSITRNKAEQELYELEFGTPHECQPPKRGGGNDGGLPVATTTTTTEVAGVATRNGDPWGDGSGHEVLSDNSFTTTTTTNNRDDKRRLWSSTGRDEKMLYSDSGLDGFKIEHDVFEESSDHQNGELSFDDVDDDDDDDDNDHDKSLQRMGQQHYNHQFLTPQTIRPAWDRRGLASIREEKSQELSCSSLSMSSPTRTDSPKVSSWHGT